MRPSTGLFATMKLLLDLLFHLILPLTSAHPTSHAKSYLALAEDDLPKSPNDPSLWAYLGTAAALVLLGGAFAGLTIALMGQDEIYLQVIATSGEGSEKKAAKKVLDLLKKGKHWVLVTLLLSNVITNETLPIVLDRSLGGGWPAVLGSTVLIVIFGEIAPQSVCVRYGLPIGAFMSPFVLVLMWILSPVAWPTAKLLDYLLGEDHGTMYKKAGLKTLVTLHRTLGQAAEERLSKDEVTIISAVLDLKEKTVGSIMTPMQDVFTLSADDVLDDAMMERILSEGYSRIPIHAVDNKTNFVGMLLVKMLITYDPEDCWKVSDFQLATLPETRPETSCLDIINFFQEGKSHMILVSEYPSEPYGALGVVTLEDVIEELIGEEIIDESDVFIDVHKAIRRLQPAPRFRVPKGQIVEQRPPPDAGLLTTQDEGDLKDPSKPLAEARDNTVPSPPGSRKPSFDHDVRSPTASAFLTRRRSSGANEPLTVRATGPELREHLKHLGPSNVATRPKPTQISSIKIKSGSNHMATVPETRPLPKDGDRPPSRVQSLTEPGKATDNERASLLSRVSEPVATGNHETQGLLSAGREASDGVHAVSYGTLSTSPTAKTRDVPTLSSTGVSFYPYGETSPSPIGRSKSPSSVSASPKSAPSSSPTKSKARPEDLIDRHIETRKADDGSCPEAREHRDGRKPHEQAHLTIQTQEKAPSTQRSSSPSSEVQHATQTPDAHIHFSPSTELHHPHDKQEEITIEGPQKLVVELQRSNSHMSEVSEHESADTVGSLHNISGTESLNGSAKKPFAMQARSGSITEQIIDVGGLKKVVLEAQPSSSDDELEGATQPPKPGSSTTSPSGPTGKHKAPQEPTIPKLDGANEGDDEDGDDQTEDTRDGEHAKTKKRTRRSKKKHRGKRKKHNSGSDGLL